MSFIRLVNIQRLDNIITFSTKRLLLASLSCSKQFSWLSSSPKPKDTGLPGATAKSLTYNIIYRFKHITSLRLLSRFKIYQTFFTIAMVPASWSMYLNGMVDLSLCYVSVSISTFAMFMLYVMSSVIQKFIGLVGFNEETSQVRLSHLTFWGKRNDVYVELNDIMPFSDIGENPREKYLKVKKYSDPNFVLYLATKYCTIEDEQIFRRIFGN